MGQGWSDLWLITQEIPKQPISIGDFYDHDFTSSGNLLTSNGTNTGYQNLCWHGAGYQKKHAVSQSRHNCCRRNEENEDKGRSKKKSKKAPPEAGLIEKFVSSMPYPRPITCWGTTHLMASTE